MTDLEIAEGRSLWASVPKDQTFKLLFSANETIVACVAMHALQHYDEALKELQAARATIKRLESLKS